MEGEEHERINLANRDHEEDKKALSEIHTQGQGTSHFHLNDIRPDSVLGVEDR